MKFYDWLMHNRHRADPIGDLARDVNTDARWPKEANSWSSVQKALPDNACEGAVHALRRAWDEFELYVGGKSHLHKDTWVHGVAGNTGLESPEN